VDVPEDIVVTFFDEAMHKLTESKNKNESTPTPRLIVVDNADHFDLVNPSHDAWKQTLQLILVHVL
jgi:hypothetical protein